MNNEKFIETLKELGRKAKSFVFSTNILIFLFFVAIAVGFWIFASLNKTYEDRVTINIKYINVPNDVEFSADLATSIDVKLKDKGNILIGLWRNESDSLVFDFAQHPEIAKSKKVSFPTAALFEKQLRAKMPSTTVIVDYSPDDIVIEKGVLKSKKVPVKLQRSVTCNDQYCISDSCTVEPQKITIYASQERLDTIDTICTSLLTAKNLSDTLRTTLRLNIPSQVKTDHPQVDVMVPVEIYIEGSVSVPVKVINVPKQYKVKTIPSEVTVKYNVGKSRYNKVTPGGFNICIDYEDLIDSNSKNLFLMVKKVPDGVINYKLSPESVEYIVY
ncbi:MAG: hypothetical protein II056_03940 [Paludibacteraceae bacterium]|nr:hypothetical protein [Paludibacteraceae bacterium]MBQ1752556.1 hypothetical protein [Paludibacteraceae bacterium]MBQ1851702.1 hypothetical protein [Paludibacteraceae bacterium]MBQ2064451.1 hypothetical protein [Paludibacteraceae bacterium]